MEVRLELLLPVAIAVGIFLEKMGDLRVRRRPRRSTRSLEPAAARAGTALSPRPAA